VDPGFCGRGTAGDLFRSRPRRSRPSAGARASDLDQAARRELDQLRGDQGGAVARPLHPSSALGDADGSRNLRLIDPSVRSLTAPFRVLARAAERLGVDVYAPPLPEKGPREVRNAAHAFNGMQERIRKLVAGRTEMLAAVSHDLRTPITRLRLRADFVEDKEQREKMFRDLDEMEAMISSTLAFLGEEARTEETRVVDVAAMLDTICDEMADSGLDVRSASEVGPAPLRCRPLALKRAFTNLIDNAVKYGGKARVLLNAAPAELAIDIEDPGPGIPEREQERVFSPFYRIESSRSRGTGGAGLGLTVARAAIRSHGGEIELANLPEGGFRVSVKLPRLAVHENSEYQAPVLDPY